MDRFRELTVFCAVAEDAAFNAAARRLHMSAPVVTRLVSALEKRIGAQLLTRTTRSVRLTEAGERFYVEAQRILVDLGEAEAIAAGAHQMPSGVLKLTAPVLFGQRFIMPIVHDFLQDNPEVSVTTMFVDRIVHLVEEGIDVALRIGSLPESSLYAVKVASVRRLIVAAPGYLQEHGIPVDTADLIDHQTINISNLNTPHEWQFEAKGKQHHAPISPRLTVNTNTAALDAAIAGRGLTRLLSYQVTDALQRGDLVEVLADCEDREMPVQLVHPSGPRAAAKTRAFIDAAAKNLRANASRLNASLSG